MRTRGLALAAGLLAAVALLGGCWGYAPDSLFRDDIRTIYVAGFDNETFRRGLEVHLTRAVVDEIRLRTPFIMAPRGEADSILSGTLVGFDEGAQVKSEEDEVLINRVAATVRFRWRDRLTGQDIVPEQTVTESVRIAESLEDTLFDLLLQETAQRMVERMQQPW